MIPAVILVALWQVLVGRQAQALLGDTQATCSFLSLHTQGSLCLEHSAQLLV